MDKNRSGLKSLIEEFSKLLDRMEATNKRAREAIKRFDETHARAEETIRKSRELLEKSENQTGDTPEP